MNASAWLHNDYAVATPCPEVGSLESAYEAECERVKEFHTLIPRYLYDRLVAQCWQMSFSELTAEWRVKSSKL